MDEFPTSGTVCDECGASALSEMYVPIEYRYPWKATTQCSSGKGDLVLSCCSHQDHQVKGPENGELWVFVYEAHEEPHSE